MWFGVDFRKPRKVSKILFDLGSSQNDFPTSFKVMAGARGLQVVEKRKRP